MSDRKLTEGEIEANLNDVYARVFSASEGPLGDRRRRAKKNADAANIKHKHATKQPRWMKETRRWLRGAHPPKS